MPEIATRSAARVAVRLCWTLAAVGVGWVSPPSSPAVDQGKVSREPEADGPAAIMTSRGFVRFQGAWRTPQEVTLLQREEAAVRDRVEAAGRLRRLRAMLDDVATVGEATEEIRESTDPEALAALSEALAAEPDRRVRALYLEALGRLAIPEAVATLAGVAVDHPDRETRYLACEQLATSGAAAAVEPILAAVGGPDNARLNRAAAATGWLIDLADITPPVTLLERLVAVLETSQTVTAGGDGSTTATFTPSGGGLSLGGGTKTSVSVVRNAAVHDALVTMTGVDFGFDRQAWQSWMASRDLPTDFDLRRDP